MPFLSKRQMKKFFALEDEGELPKGTAKKWLKETKNVKKLPEKVKKEKTISLAIIFENFIRKNIRRLIYDGNA